MFKSCQETLDSEIIDDLNKLNKLLNLNIKKYKLLYRASMDGFNAFKFHNQCDNQGATVTIIKCGDGIICGGYSSKSWDSSGDYKRANGSFLFSYTKMTKHEMKIQHKNDLVLKNPTQNYAMHCKNN